MKAILKALILVILFIAACKKEKRGDCFKSTGEIIKEYREISPFDSIYVQDNINIIITLDTIWEIRAEGGENLLPKIITKIENGKLSLSNVNRCNFVRSFKNTVTVFIKTPSIKGIEANGNGLIKSTNTITTDKLFIKTNNTSDFDLALEVATISTDIHGSSDVKLTGTAGSHNASITGTGSVKASKLITGQTIISANTTGNSYVNATKTIDVTIRGSGNIYYSGNPPEVKSTVTGPGKLIGD